MHWVDGLGGGPGGVSMTPPRGMHRTPLRNASFLGVISGSVSGHVSTLFVPSLTRMGSKSGVGFWRKVMHTSIGGNLCIESTQSCTQRMHPF